jgi:hypothetical protein
LLDVQEPDENLGRQKMPSGGYRPGVPLQAPYTKYDTDADEIRVEYKRVDNNNSPLHRGSRTSSSLSLSGLGFHSPDGATWFSGYKGAVLRVLVIVVVFMVGLVVGYVVRRTVREMALQVAGNDACGQTERTGEPAEYQVCNCVCSR